MEKPDPAKVEKPEKQPATPKKRRKPTPTEQQKRRGRPLPKQKKNKPQPQGHNPPPKKTKKGEKKEEKKTPHRGTPPPLPRNKKKKPKQPPRKEASHPSISLNGLYAFKNHPFEVRMMKKCGLWCPASGTRATQPAIVRPREDGGYEIVSGHRRQKASEGLPGMRICPVSSET